METNNPVAGALRLLASAVEHATKARESASAAANLVGNGSFDTSFEEKIASILLNASHSTPPTSHPKSAKYAWSKLDIHGLHFVAKLLGDIEAVNHHKLYGGLVIYNTLLKRPVEFKCKNVKHRLKTEKAIRYSQFLDKTAEEYKGKKAAEEEDAAEEAAATEKAADATEKVIGSNADDEGVDTSGSEDEYGSL